MTSVASQKGTHHIIFQTCIINGYPTEYPRIYGTDTSAGYPERISRRQSRNLAISFIQVGKDKAGKRFLKMLDDELVKDGCKFDIVDTKTCTEVKQLGLVETLRQAITD
ncbi:von Willebrand factor type A [Balamuthia mandrillaris]